MGGRVVHALDWIGRRSGGRVLALRQGLERALGAQQRPRRALLDARGREGRRRRGQERGFHDRHNLGRLPRFEVGRNLALTHSFGRFCGNFGWLKFAALNASAPRLQREAGNGAAPILCSQIGRAAFAANVRLSTHRSLDARRAACIRGAKESYFQLPQKGQAKPQRSANRIGGRVVEALLREPIRPPARNLHKAEHDEPT